MRAALLDPSAYYHIVTEVQYFLKYWRPRIVNKQLSSRLAIALQEGILIRRQSERPPSWRDFTIIAASKAAMRGATILKASDDKTRALNDHTLMAFAGEAGDTIQFAEFIQANISLYSTRNSYSLPTSSIANFTRGELARSLRSRKPYQVNLLLGGVELPTLTSSSSTGDSSATSATTGTATQTTSGNPNIPSDTSATAEAGKVKPRLYWMDYLASLAEVPYAAHGYAQYYCLSILDKHHHPDIDLERGMQLLRMCSEELRRRLPVDFKGMTVKVVTADGIKEVELNDDVNAKMA